jgi:hypothetical protein
MRSLLAALALALCAAAATLALDPSGGRASGEVWTAATRLDTCAAAIDPHVVFPFSAPASSSGAGGIVWLGGAPPCAAGRPTLDIAALDANDAPAAPRALVVGAAAKSALSGPLYTASTTRGQIVAIAGAGAQAVLGDGTALGGISSLAPLGGPDAPAATMDGFIGDADVATLVHSPSGWAIAVRAQRHYAGHFGAGFELAVGRVEPNALAIGMDFRADRLIIWSAAGHVHAQYVTNNGRIEPSQLLGPSGYDPQIAAVLSDDDRAFVLWSDEPAPGVSAATTIYLAHAGFGPRFGAASTLASFTEPAGVRLGPGAVAAERLSSEGVALLWPDIASGNYVIDAAGATESGAVLTPSVLAQSGEDLRLGAVAAGPDNEIVVVVLEAPRGANGFDDTQQSILVTRSNEVRDPGGLGFGPLSELAAAGENTAPSVAIDPGTDAAVAAWQSGSGIDYSVGTGS